MVLVDFQFPLVKKHLSVCNVNKLDYSVSEMPVSVFLTS